MLLSVVLAGCAAPASGAPSGTIAPSSVSPSSAVSAPAPGSAHVPGATPTPVPAFSHIYLIVLENKEGSAIIDNAAAPYINRLATGYGLATNYTAIGHPSEPNYIALASGSTNGVSDDGVHDLTAPSLFDEIGAAGRTWQVAAQNDRPGCFAGTTASGGEDGPGTYARKHNPAISFRSISRNPAQCARITDFKGFDPAGAAFSWIVPNMCNSMHDCSVATGDTWLASFLPRILASSAYRQGGLILLTFDEGSTNLGGGGRVATIVISPLARTGYVSAIAHDHYSLLRTIQAAWGLPCLARACQANDLREFFR
jgi:phospholipase C